MSSGFSPVFPCVLLAVTAVAVARACRRDSVGASAGLLKIDASIAAAIAGLFAVVALRGMIGLLFDFPWSGTMALGLAFAAAGGKAMGGVLADRFGAVRTALVTLIAAAGLFAFSDHPLPGLIAVACFNATMPLTLSAAARLLPGIRGFAFGLLTLALFLGFAPVFFGWRPPFDGAALYAAASLLSLPPLLRALRRC